MPFPPDLSKKIDARGKFKLEPCLNERALLSILTSRLSSIDPDVIVAHNYLGFDLDLLLHRAKDNKIPHWSKLGRLRRSILPKLQVFILILRKWIFIKSTYDTQIDIFLAYLPNCAQRNELIFTLFLLLRVTCAHPPQSAR
jgi:hypothetical protein